MSVKQMFPDPKVRALANAAAKGKLDKVDQLVSEGVDVNARGAKNATPLFWAMQNYQGFVHLLKLGADPNAVFDDGGAIMHWAVSAEDDRLLKAALENGGNPNLIVSTRTKNMLFPNETPLFAATGPRTKHQAPVLLEAGANINAQLLSGTTPILRAAGKHQYDLVYLFLEEGADYLHMDNSGRDLAHKISKSKKIMDPDSQGYPWLFRVIDWLEVRGVEIPE